MDRHRICKAIVEEHRKRIEHYLVEWDISCLNLCWELTHLRTGTKVRLREDLQCLMEYRIAALILGEDNTVLYVLSYEDDNGLIGYFITEIEDIIEIGSPPTKAKLVDLWVNARILQKPDLEFLSTKVPADGIWRAARPVWAPSPLPYTGLDTISEHTGLSLQQLNKIVSKHVRYRAVVNAEILLRPRQQVSRRQIVAERFGADNIKYIEDVYDTVKLTNRQLLPAAYLSTVDGTESFENIIS